MRQTIALQSPHGEKREARLEPRGLQGAATDRLVVRDGLRPPHHDATHGFAALGLGKKLGAVVLLALALSAPAHAVEPDEILANAALETRARSVSEGLRCLVCQNESIDESHAALARDIRLLVRQRLIAGDTDQQVRDYLVARYGQFILLRPPIEWQTLLLWGTPGLVLLLGGGAMWAASRRKPVRDPARPLSDSERACLDEVLAEP